MFHHALRLIATVVVAGLGITLVPPQSMIDSRDGLPVEIGHGLLAQWAAGPVARPAGYAPSGRGDDLSYPACGRTPPDGVAFAMVGLNNGKAFSANPCVAQEWGDASGPRTVYLNTGYSPTNSGWVTASCRDRSLSLDGGSEQRLAYAIGCSEAAYSLAYIAQSGLSGFSPVIWLDVEPSNSWSTGDLTLNLSALGGMIDRLAELKLPIGIYSSPVWWDEIMGGVTNRLVVADWVAGVPIDRACTGRGFSGAPVWLVQELAPWVGPDGAGFDSDRVC